MIITKRHIIAIASITQGAAWFVLGALGEYWELAGIALCALVGGIVVLRMLPSIRLKEQILPPREGLTAASMPALQFIQPVTYIQSQSSAPAPASEPQERELSEEAVPDKELDLDFLLSAVEWNDGPTRRANGGNGRPPAPWDSFTGDAAHDLNYPPVPIAPHPRLLPRRPPRADEYPIVWQAILDEGGSRRQACVVVWGSRDGRTYAWLRKVAEYYELPEEERPHLLIWELLGTERTAIDVIDQLRLDVSVQEAARLVESAGLVNCQTCGAWSYGGELKDGMCPYCQEDPEG